MTATPPVPGAHMRAEIAEQPDRWRGFAVQGRDEVLTAVGRIRAHQPTMALLIARGTSDHAALYGQYALQNLLGLPALLATPSVASVYGRDIVPSRAVALALSQSGESPDLIAMVASAARSRALTIAMTNQPGSTLAAAAQLHIDLRADDEQAVAATKSYTAELLALWAMVSVLAGARWAEVSDGIAHLAQVAEEVLTRVDGDVERAAALVAGEDRVLVVGRGYGFATAKEAALKLMETSGIAASGWSAADVRHGPLGQVRPGTPVILLTSAAEGRESLVMAYEAVVARGGVPIVVGSPIAERGDGDVVLDVGGRVAPELVPLLEILPIQQLALRVALLRGQDPDRPVGLSKVTRTL